MMKIREYEDYLSKKMDQWNSEDVSRLIANFGEKPILLGIENTENNHLKVMKMRYLLEHDDKIKGFMKVENDEYQYIINFIKEYIKTVPFILWPSELGLHLIYKILCERALSEGFLKEDKGNLREEFDSIIVEMINSFNKVREELKLVNEKEQ